MVIQWHTWWPLRQKFQSRLMGGLGAVFSAELPKWVTSLVTRVIFNNEVRSTFFFRMSFNLNCLTFYKLACSLHYHQWDIRKTKTSPWPPKLIQKHKPLTTRWSHQQPLGNTQDNHIPISTSLEISGLYGHSWLSRDREKPSQYSQDPQLTQNYEGNLNK